MASTLDKYAIGIDIGTTYCSVAVYKNGIVKVVEDRQGNRRIPSYVAFTEDEYLVGFLAKSQAAVNPSNTVHGIKRLLGRKFDDTELASDFKYWPFNVINDKGRPQIQVQYKNQSNTFFPEQITALILTAMKEMAESYIGHSGISDVVISVPANFNDLQRKATMDAAHISGLHVLQLINDSTAAAIAYCTEKKITDKCNLLVFDLGGGSFDVSMVAIQDSKLEEKAVSGETHLGGDDFVNNMLDHIAKDFQLTENTDTASKKFLAILKDACESAKQELSKLPETRIQVEGCDYSHKLNTDIFNKYNKPLYENMMDHVQKVLSDSKIDKDNFSILLVGGCTRIPKVEEMLKAAFSGTRISKGINRDEAVAYGAAVLAALQHADNSGAIAHFVEIVDQPDNIIISDKYGMSEEKIASLKQIALGLKNDCNIYKERMQCRNNLEGYVIRVQAELRIKNNDVIMGKCDEILDWMSSNEKAGKEEYHRRENDLQKLCKDNSIEVSESSSPPTTASTEPTNSKNQTPNNGSHASGTNKTKTPNKMSIKQIWPSIKKLLRLDKIIRKSVTTVLNPENEGSPTKPSEASYKICAKQENEESLPKRTAVSSKICAKQENEESLAKPSGITEEPPQLTTPAEDIAKSDDGRNCGIQRTSSTECTRL